MTIKFRFTLLLGLLLGAFLLLLLLLLDLDRAAKVHLTASDRNVRETLLDHWVDEVGRSLPRVADDLAESDSLATLLAGRDELPARAQIGAGLAKANASALWIVSPDPVAPVRAFTSTGAEPSTLPFNPSDLDALFARAPSPRFFVEADGSLFEVCVRRFKAGGNRDFIFVARRWDEAQVRLLSSLTDSIVTIKAVSESKGVPALPKKLMVTRRLEDWRGRAIRELRVESDLPNSAVAERLTLHPGTLFVAYGLLVVLAMTLALQAWVLRPLGKIREGLATHETDALVPLSRENNELGGMAGLVISSLAQEQALKAEIEERKRAEVALARSEAELRQNFEERARVGRDLHDGVIQSLYAAGMGLAGIRRQLLPDQVEVLARLEQTRAVLNETIHDVRNSIVGLEPEALKAQSFSQAVAGLLETMQSIRAFHSSVAIDDTLAGGLTLSQRVHALQITREAVSNALRHGEAGRIEVVLRHESRHVEFEVSDDGRGFDATSASSHGRGLVNFSQRARELGAEMSVESQVGQGTRVKLIFPLTS
ncbi:sensor histidine kinase [Horticoccus sp. 23ND18S-11]|uniref:sensor histidine kinase n=1 Tax=Horticoccus sp. 23ND18S-11 TaxID=3391832 RepID=UPI0039C90C6A